MATVSAGKKKAKPKPTSKRRPPKKRRPVREAKKWRTYEEVTAYLLNQFAKRFGLGRFDGKQVVAGASGTEWELDARGCSVDGTHFINVECKRHTKSGIPQAIVAGTAWAIKDTGANGGIVVSPCGLQKGAKKVANSANIIEVVLSHDSTKTDYFMRFLDTICKGVSDVAAVSIGESLTITESDSQGNVISTKKIV